MGKKKKKTFKKKLKINLKKKKNVETFGESIFLEGKCRKKKKKKKNHQQFLNQKPLPGSFVLLSFGQRDGEKQKKKVFSVNLKVTPEFQSL